MSEFPDVTETVAFEAVIGDGTPVIAKFQSEACVICRKIEPMLAATARRFDGALAVVDVDAEKNLELAARYNIRGLPTLILFQNGDEIGRRNGFQTASMLREWVSSLVGEECT
jgi:thioredoxin-like negative regulator of GroEL